MKLFGLTLFEPRAVDKADKYLTVDTRGGWYRILESFGGAWQQNVEVDRDTALSYSTVFACATLIAQDIGKLKLKLMEKTPGGVSVETQSNAFTPVLRKPNHYQTRIKFVEYWISCKLLHGNAYALKVRDQRGVVVALYLLDPSPGSVTPLVTPGGDVYYRLKADPLSKVEDQITVPASEIIHDPMVTLYHPLVGVTPIYACGLAAIQGLNMQNNSARFFGNQSQPGGILTAPGSISDTTAARLKTYWEENFTGENAGKVAVVGDGLKYERLTVNASDSQMIEQLRMSAETVCSCFHIPPFMVGVGPMPSYNNVEALVLQYYSQCLQSLIESFELCLDEGLGLGKSTPPYHTQFDLDGLLRMDTATRYKAHSDAIGGGWLSPNEARAKESLTPVSGGSTPYMQQQNYSLAALNRRDSSEEEEDVNVQAQAMNGGQITSLQSLIASAAAGDVPLETAKATIAAAYPSLTPEQINAMLNPLDGFQQPQPAPIASPVEDEPVEDEPVEDEPVEDEPVEDEDQEEEIRALLMHIERGLDEAMVA